MTLTLSQMSNFRLKQFEDDNFKFDENGRCFSKRVENTVGKGEIAPCEQFLLFPQWFQRLLLQTRKNKGLFGKGLTEFVTKQPNLNLSYGNSPKYSDGKK